MKMYIGKFEDNDDVFIFFEDSRIVVNLSYIIRCELSCGLISRRIPVFAWNVYLRQLDDDSECEYSLDDFERVCEENADVISLEYLKWKNYYSILNNSEYNISSVKEIW